MNKLAFVLVAAATLLVAAPALAQVSIRAGDQGVAFASALVIPIAFTGATAATNAARSLCASVCRTARG